MTKNMPGRPNGHLMYAEAFEAIIAARNLRKKDVADDAGISPSYLADLLAMRGGADPAVAERIARSIGVRTEAVFPGLAGWIGPLPDRNARRVRTTPKRDARTPGSSTTPAVA
jgi:transcriptional regulator with XRE-family HTH domain